VAGVDLDGCRACGGAFFDAGELSTLAREPEKLFEVDAAFRPTQRPMNQSTSNTCPKCDVAMTRFEQPSLRGIELDACGTCKGIWLDGGEASEIARRRGATPPTPGAPPAPIARSADEARAPAPRWSREKRVNFVLGALVLIALPISLSHSVHLLSLERAAGRVVHVERYGWGRRQQRYAVVEFNVGGAPFTVRRNLGAFERLDDADPVEILYPRDAPQDGQLRTFWSVWGLPAFILALGGLLVARALGVSFGA
jgi:Zn-finger nucleic acid-binding protein